MLCHCLVHNTGQRSAGPVWFPPMFLSLLSTEWVKDWRGYPLPQSGTTTYFPNTSGSWAHPQARFRKLHSVPSPFEEQDFITHPLQNSRTGTQEEIWEPPSSNPKYHPKPFPWKIPCSPRRASRGGGSPFNHAAPFLSPLSQGGLWAAAPPAMGAL